MNLGKNETRRPLKWRVERRLMAGVAALMLGFATAMGVCAYGVLIAAEPSANRMIVYNVRGARAVWTGYRLPGRFEDQFRTWDHSGARTGTMDERWRQVSSGAYALNVDPRLFPGSVLRAAEAELSNKQILEGGMALFVQGWPLRMAWYMEHWSGRPVMDTFVRRGPAINKKLKVDPMTYPKSGTRFMGLRPLWGGVIGNSLLFGAAWGVLFSLPGLAMAIRRRRRRRRGHCVGCGYDLRGLGGACPECGKAR